MTRDMFGMSNANNSFTQMMNIEKFVDKHSNEVTIGSMLTYTIVLENISEVDLESVCVIEDLISGLKYKKDSLKINGIKPYGGDIDLDENVIIPIGIMRARAEDSYTNSKIVITFNVIVDKIPCQQPIFNYARVIFKYNKGHECLTGIETSNKVLVPFNVSTKDEEIMKLVEDKTVIGKGPGDNVQFIIALEPESPMENVVLSDYIDKRLELLSVIVIRDKELEEIEHPNITGLKIGYIDRGEKVDVLINTRIKDNKAYSCNDCTSGCEVITNQATIKYINPYNKYTVNKETNKVYLYVYYANINAEKTVDKECVDIGDIVTYKIKLIHCGSAIVENIILKDKLPSSLEYVNDSAEIVYYSEDFRSKINYNAKDGILKIPVLDIGEEVSIYLKAKVVSGPVDDSNEIVNNAYLTYSYLKYPEAEDISERHHTIVNQPISKTQPICINSADLLSTLKKEASATCNSSCNVIKYKILFTNTGNLCAKNVNIRDFISDGVALDTKSVEVVTNRPPGPKDYDGSLPNILIQEVHPGEKIVIAFNAIVDSVKEEFVVENCADITYQYFPCNKKRPITIEGETNKTFTRIAARKISSKLTINGQTSTNIEVGQEAVYRVEIKNTSPHELIDVVYDLKLSNGFNQYIKYKNGSLKIKGGTPPTIDINPNNTPIKLGKLKPFETVIIEFIEIGLDKTNRPIASYLQGQYSYEDHEEVVVCTDKTNEATITITGQMVKIVKEAYSYCPPLLIGCVPKLITGASPGERITYKITISNMSRAALEDVSLEDILPRDVKYVPNSVKINGVPVTEELLPSLYLGNIKAGERVIVEFDVIVNKDISATSVVNTACIEYFYVIDPCVCKRMKGKSCATNEIEIEGPNFKKSFAKYVEEVGQVKDFKSPNQNINYIIQFKNEGNQDAFNVVLSDTIPESVGYFIGSLVVTPSVPAANIKQPSGADRLLQIKFDTVPVGQMYTVKWTSPIKPTFTQGDIVNNADLNYSYVTDSTGLTTNQNITSNDVVTHVSSAKIEITKSADPTITDINVPINYKIEIKNKGNVIANNVFLRDFLPLQNLEYIPGTLRVNGLPTNFDIKTGILIGSLGVYNPVTDSPKAVVTYQLVSKVPPKTNPIPNDAEVSYTYRVNPNTSQEISEVSTSNLVGVEIKAADLEFIKPTKKSSELVVSNTDPAKKTGNYEISLVNSGNITALNIVIQDTLPNGLDFVPKTVTVKGFDKNGNPIQLKVNSIPPGGELNIENGISVDQLPPLAKLVTTFTYITDGTKKGFVDNTAHYSYSYITSETLINKPNNSTDIATVLIVDDLLDVKKSVAPTVYCPGQTLLYTMDIRNISGGTISNVTFQDTIPAATEYIPGTFIVDFKPVTINGNTITQGNIASGVNLGTIPLAGSKVVQFQVKVSETNPPKTLSNTGVVRFVANTIPSKKYESTAIATLSNICPVPPQTPVAMNKTAFSYCPPGLVGCVPTTISSAKLGDRITYKVTVKNIDSSTVSNVVFTDVLPKEVSYIPNTLKVNGVLVPNANPISVNLGTIPSNTTFTVEFDVKINAIPSGDLISNTANTTYNYFINCPSCTITNGSSSATNNLAVSSANVQMTKTANPDQVDLNTPITYSITLANIGNTTVNNLFVKDVLPPYLSYIPNSLVVNGVTVPQNPQNGVLLGSLGVYNPSTQKPIDTITFKVLATSIPPTNPVINIASSTYTYLVNGTEVSGQSQSNEENVSVFAADLTSVKPTKESNKTTFYRKDTANNTGEYTITLFNSGNRSALNVKLTDTLPNGLLFVPQSVTVTGFDESGKIVPLVVNSVPPGGPLDVEDGIVIDQIPPKIKAVIKFSYKVQPNAPDKIDNTATFDYSYISTNTIVNKTNNVTNTATIYVVDGGQGLSKISSPEEVCPGQTVLYTITMDNSIGTTLTNVVLQDTIPCGTCFVPSSFTVDFKPLEIDGKPVTAKMLSKGIYIGTIPAGGKLIAQYQATISCKCHPNPVENIANLIYEGGSYNAVSLTTIGHSCICNCNQYCNDGASNTDDCSMCWNKNTQSLSNENLYNKSPNKNTQSTWKRIGKNTARVSK